MVNFRWIILFVVFPLFVFSQKAENVFSIINIKKFNKIEYAVFGEFDNKKNTLFFIEGSMPSPSFSIINDSLFYYSGPHSITNLAKIFNLIILGKPAIPISIDNDKIPKDFIYRDSTGKTPQAFFLNDNLNYYVDVYCSLITKLKKQEKLGKIFVFGHSQGARIACAVANQNKKINGLIFACADPLGRIASVIDKNFVNNEKPNKISYIQQIIKNGTNSTDSTFMKSTYFSWQSFSYPIITTLCTIDVPTFIIYGKNDRNCPNCYVYDYLNVYNNNITTLKVDGDHNFIDEEGVMHWDDVVDEIISWLHKH